jgi:hypothetical protein
MDTTANTPDVGQDCDTAFHDVSLFGFLEISPLRRHRRCERLDRPAPLLPNIATYGCKRCLGWLYLQRMSSDGSLNGCDAHNVSHRRQFVSLQCDCGDLMPLLRSASLLRHSRLTQTG